MYTSDACPYCTRAKRFLARKGIAFEEIYVDRRDPAARDFLVTLTGRYTVPQILIGETPIGGWDDMKALDDAGRLDPLLGVGPA
jgi:glutaredoxin 3